MRPNEWLIDLVTTPGAYQKLVEETGCLALAAYRLARARCQVWAVPTEVPTAREVGAAAREIAERAGLDALVPAGRALALDCERAGLLVL